MNAIKWQKTLRFPLLLALLAALTLAFVPAGWADDDDDDDHKRRKRKSWGFSMEDAVEPTENALYIKECGACHFAFPPALLPGRSWEAMLNGLEDHFGKDATLPPKTIAELRVYLIQHAAETSRGETAYKILRSLKGATPLRITETPYILREHHEISASILARKSIGTLANCTACHTRAEQGDFDDDRVVIPR